MKKIILLIMIVLLSFNVFGALTDNLIGYYKMDNTTGNVSNEVVGLSNLIMGGTVGSTTDAVIGTARGYISPSGYFTSSKTSWVLNSNASIAMWVKFNESQLVNNGYVYLAGSGYDANADSMSLLIEYVNATKLFRWKMYDRNGAEYNAYFNATPINLSKWYSIICVYNGSSKVGSIYVDGVIGVNATNLNTNSKATTNTFQIGTSDTFFNGQRIIVDEVGVWNRTLLPEEILQLYNNKAGLTYPFIRYLNFTTTIPLNTTYTFNTTPTFYGMVNNYYGSYDVNLIINNTIKATLTNVTNGSISLQTTTLTSGAEYLWWFNGTDNLNSSNYFVSEMRNIYIAGASGGTTNPVKTCIFNPNKIGLNDITGCI
jgi:hypothetical protein